MSNRNINWFKPLNKWSGKKSPTGGNGNDSLIHLLHPSSEHTADMTREALKLAYPNCSAAFLARNASQDGQASPDDHRPRLHAVQPQSNERVPLDARPEGEETRWYASARRFEILFTVHSQRPCDWDGWDIKALQDFLVRAGIIPDDGWKTLSGRVVSEKVATGSRRRKTVITITAC